MVRLGKTTRVGNCVDGLVLLPSLGPGCLNRTRMVMQHYVFLSFGQKASRTLISKLTDHQISGIQHAAR